MHIYQIIKLTVILFYFSYTIAYGIVLLNSSYDVSRELFSELNASFINYWNQKNPDNKDVLIIRQSHAGSTRQAIAVLQGLRADVVTYNQVVDIQMLCDRGHLIDKNWRDRLPNHSSPFYSTMAFIVRSGNPKKVYDWRDLTQEGLQIVLPNPKISGNGRYAYLAAWDVFFNYNQGNLEQTRIWMQKFLKNVIVFDTGGRSATSTFIDRKQGDVLINFESEAKIIQKKHNFDNCEVIIPKLNILVEFPVTWVDKNVIQNGTKNIAQDYLKYLYTCEAQKIIIKFGYRIYSDDSVRVHDKKNSMVQLFRVEDRYGNCWDTIMKTHFKRGGELDKLLLAGCR